MPTQFILDTREHGLQAIFNRNSIPHKVKQLDLGDILILYSKGEIKDKNDQMSDAGKKLLRVDKSDEKIGDEIHTIVIERKSFSDLKSSLSDGRYREQKSRYIQLQRGTAYYLLEKDKTGYDVLDRKQYLGMYVHTMMRDKIPVFITDSIEDTADFLIKMSKTLEEFGLETTGTIACPMEKTQIKKKKASGKDVFINMISCISGISIMKAKQISEIYANINDVIDAIKNETFQVKGIGPALIKNIRDGLLLDE